MRTIDVGRRLSTDATITRSARSGRQCGIDLDSRTVDSSRLGLIDGIDDLVDLVIQGLGSNGTCNANDAASRFNRDCQEFCVRA